MKLFRGKKQIPLVMMVVSVIVFCILYGNMARYYVEPKYLSFLVYGIPCIVFGGLAFLVYKKRAVIFAIVTTAVLVPIFIVGFSYLLLVESVEVATTTITDVGNYERILDTSRGEMEDLLSMFPKVLSSNWERLSLFYCPPYLQGGEVFSFSFRSDKKSLREYKEIYEKRAIPIDLKNPIVQTKKLSQDFLCYQLVSKPYKVGDWNHGKCSYVAISEKRSEIYFYAEVW